MKNLISFLLIFYSLNLMAQCDLKIELSENFYISSAGKKVIFKPFSDITESISIDVKKFKPIESENLFYRLSFYLYQSNDNPIDEKSLCLIKTNSDSLIELKTISTAYPSFYTLGSDGISLNSIIASYEIDEDFVRFILSDGIKKIRIEKGYGYQDFYPKEKLVNIFLERLNCLLILDLNIDKKETELYKDF